MTQLNLILNGVQILNTVGSIEREINQIHFDSRKVSKNDLFFAVKGTTSDGHKFIDSVIEQGAITIICENLPQTINENITYIVVEDTSYAVGKVASNFYNNPSSKMKLIGATGTNGKTSTVRLSHQLFRKLGFNVGLLSTVNNKINDEIIPSTHTTPDAIQLNELLNKMVDANCEYCFMEVSSHSIHQNRIAGLQFSGVVFTNITHDHLDYHKTFEEYFRVKKSFIDNLSANSFVLTNIDDPKGNEIVKNSNAKIYTLSTQVDANFTSKIISSNLSGLTIEIEKTPIQLKLLGTFNAYNSLSVYAIAVCLGIGKSNILDLLPTLDPIIGRFNFISHKNIIGIVDFAHSPDALTNILQNIRSLNPRKIITVLGCGGDRDKEKRPIMGKILLELSDVKYLTSDNPRSEDPMKIIEEMVPNLDSLEQVEVHFGINREKSIKYAVSEAKEGDVILVAGKGHETYQEIQGVKYPFDDMEILKKYLFQK